MAVKFSGFTSSSLNSTGFIVGYDAATNSNIRISKSALDTIYQATLISTTNIKTINGNSILGSGNLVVGNLTVGTTLITSGAVGRILFEGTGNVLQQNANLFWDNTNSRLGIRNSTPTASLHIIGSGTTGATKSFISQNSAGAVNATIYDSGGWFIGSGNYKLENTTGEKFDFSDASGNVASIGMFNVFFSPLAYASSLQITTNFKLLGANVLIGTSTDAGAKLQVKSTGNTSATTALSILSSTSVEFFKIASDGNITALHENNGFSINATSLGNSGTISIGTITGKADAGIGQGNLCIGAGSSTVGSTSATAYGNYSFAASNAIAIGPRSSATSINTFVAGGWTDADGTGSAINNVYFGNGMPSVTAYGGGPSGLDGTAYTIWGAGAKGSYIYGTGNKNGGNITIHGGLATGSGVNGDILFGTGITGASGTTIATGATRAVIKGGSGNMLIGTTTDAGYKLDVNGSGRISGPLSAGGGSATGTGSVSIGTFSSAGGSSYACAIGYDAQASNNHAIAIGYGSRAYVNSSYAFGYAASASGQYSTAFSGSSAYAQYSVAFGNNSRAGGVSSMAGGAGAFSYLTGQLAISGGSLNYYGDSQMSLYTSNLNTGIVNSGGTYSFTGVRPSNQTFSSGVSQIWYVECVVVFAVKGKTAAITEFALRDTFTIRYKLAVKSTDSIGTSIIGTPVADSSFSDASMATTSVTFTIVSDNLVVNVIPPTWASGGQMQFRGTASFQLTELGVYGQNF